MKEIDLEEIYSKTVEISNHGDFITISKDSIIEFAKESCRQTLELAAENVGFIETTSDKLNSLDYMPFITADDNTIWTFDKQSILDTINQIK